MYHIVDNNWNMKSLFYGCLSTLLFMYCFYFRPCAAEGFTSGSGVVRVTPGGVASLNWTLTSLAAYNGKIFKGSDPDANCILIYDYGLVSYVRCLPGYQARTQLHFGGQTVGFSLSDVTSADAGVYGCRHSFPSSSGGRQTNTQATIYVFGNPTKPDIASPPDVPEGDDVTLTCQSTSTSRPSEHRQPLSYTWLRDDQTVTTGSSARHTVSGGRLTVEDVVREDRMSRYSCVAEDGGLQSEASSEIQLNVLYVDADIGLDGGGSTLRVIENSTVTVSCEASCTPQCQLEWINQTDQSVYSFTRQLHIEKVTRHDSGQYTCSISNTQAADEAHFTLEVQHVPDVTFQADPQSPVQEGGRVSLSCQGTSVPDSDVTLHNVTSGYSLPAYIGSNLAGYTFDEISCHEAGEYRCVASNSVGTATASLGIDVLCSPSIYFIHPSTGVIEVTTGDTASFVVGVIASPFLNTSRDNWRFENMSGSVVSLPEEAETLTSENKVVLLIYDVQGSHFGTYTVILNNGLGDRVEQSFTLTEKRSSLDPAVLAGLAVLSVIVVTLAVILIVDVVKWRRRQHKAPDGHTNSTAGSHAMTTVSPSDGSYENVDDPRISDLADISRPAADDTQRPYQTLDGATDASVSTYLNEQHQAGLYEQIMDNRG